ncbi:cytochrome P450 [Lentzea sp. NBRC 105346]|nr:cytochrome P450 [Lentzea sp. NBRC 105346]
MVKDSCPFPFAVNHLNDLSDGYGDMRANNPVPRVVLPSGDPAYLITRYADAQAVLADRRFSANISRPEAARLREGPDGNLSNPFSDDRAWHIRWRRLMALGLNPRVVERAHGPIQEIAHELAAEMAAMTPPVDLLEAYATRLPVEAICVFLGIPPLDRAKIRRCVDALGTSSAADFEERAEAGREMWEYGASLIAYKRDEPGDDLVTSLIAAHDEEDGKLSEEELVLSFMALIVGNNISTAQQIGQGVFTLLCNPDQLAALRADRDLLPGAIEELLRVTPIYTGLPRFATEDIEVGGVLIPRNATVLVVRQSAHQDDTWIEAPEVCDIKRTNANRHLAFGYGHSFCIGAAFARLQLRCAFTALMDRFPALELAVPESEVGWSYRLMGSGATAIPVTW